LIVPGIFLFNQSSKGRMAGPSTTAAGSERFALIKISRSGRSMPFAPARMIAEYLERALAFGRMAAREEKPQIRAVFEKQAATYRKLAADRAQKVRLG
jgi:hypothetical protein